ncbi:MAG: hypothetical protein AB1592_06345 [Pseudomonadota bacterium]
MADPRSAARWPVVALILGATLATGSDRAHAHSTAGEPLSRLDQIGPALRACWNAPAGSAGSHITFRFGLNAQGMLKGAPLATHSHLTGDAAMQRAFVAAALTALQTCTPLRLTPDLARAVGARVLTLRFSAEPRVRAVDI